jgi:hypothetical protein
VPVEDVVDVGADQGLVLVCRHGPCSPTALIVDPELGKSI